jgi:hypothetical protein
MLVGLREPLLNDWNHKQFCWFSYHTSNFKKPYDEGRVKVKWLSGYGFLIEHHKKPSHRRLLFSAVAAKLSSNFQQTTKPIFYRGDSHRKHEIHETDSAIMFQRHSKMARTPRYITTSRRATFEKEKFETSDGPNWLSSTSFFSLGHKLRCLHGPSS